MTFAQDQAAAQAAFKADFDQFKLDFAALVQQLLNASNSGDEAALQASIAGFQTMKADLDAMDATAVSAVKPPVVTPPPTVPPAPTSVVATAGVLQNTVTWGPVTGADSFNLYWSLASGVTIATATLVKGATSPFVQTGLTAGAAVFYALTAVNAAGESVLSSEVAATPNAGTAPSPAPLPTP